MKIEDLNYVFNEKVIFKKVKSSDDGTFLIIAHNPNTGDMYEFNSVGSDLFELLKKNISIKEIIERLVEMYDVQADEIYDGIVPFIERFIELGLIFTVEKNEE